MTDNVVSLKIIEKKALSLYVLAGVPGYAWDFVETIAECENIPVLKMLHELLSTENADQSEEDRERNKLAAPIVAERLARLEGR